ncbi:hypothetical protein [Novipirellula artificiosorum]|uniref:Uncharacterized protein n=1 Tax=Novipirellula artificiosorum TaxID=2528016 RepID=A0A5C6DLA8_9BACT|nr:hypothetical protein [Novipirellula artificiosorum]TWU37392.1 hypothetical protein Poly41_35220 [Novipirellula artificiosorum]
MNTSEVLVAEWTREQILALFADLAAGAEITHVQLRCADGDNPVALQDAETAYRAGSAIAIQIRYRFNGEHWSDTLMTAEPSGVDVTKIIRSRLP